MIRLFGITICMYALLGTSVTLANPPNGIAGNVTVANDAANPVPVTGTVEVTGAVDARIDNNPGTESFWAKGFHEIESDTNGNKHAISFVLDFVFPQSNSDSSDRVPSGKIAVVEYLSCTIGETSGGTFAVSDMFKFLTSAGGSVKSLHALPWVESGGFTRAHFNGPVRLYANSGSVLKISGGASGPSLTLCNATGYFLDKP